MAEHHLQIVDEGAIVPGSGAAKGELAKKRSSRYTGACGIRTNHRVNRSKFPVTELALIATYTVA